MDPMPPELHEAADAWDFHVMLECSGKEDTTVAIGGDVLDMEDLSRILRWAVSTLQVPSSMEVRSRLAAYQHRYGMDTRTVSALSGIPERALSRFRLDRMDLSQENFKKLTTFLGEV